MSLHDRFLQERFFPYQARWLQDPAQFKIGLWARQTGKDYTCAAEAVIDCLRRKTHWLIVAAGERQALESLEKARLWATALTRKLSASARPPGIAACTASEIRFANGSRITALPAKPETVRGYSANIILTEFAFHEDPEAIWRAVFPSVSNPLRGGGKKLRVITTPNGQGNFFHRLWLASNNFSKHRVTITEAHTQGLPIDLPALKQGLGNAEAWAQEYECEFLDGTSVLLPLNLIESCEASEATETSTLHLLSTVAGELYAGIDFGRKKDLTVCWLLERLPSPNSARNTDPGRNTNPFSALNPQYRYLTREVLVLQNLPTPAQLEILRPRVARVRRVCLDYTGAGIGLGDLLSAEFGSGNPGTKYTHRVGAAFSASASRLELCQFTAALKGEIFPALRSAFERGILGVPASSEIRQDLHGVHKFVTQHGQVTYRASHTADGHSDRCTALALALRAAENAPPTSCASTVEVVRRSRIR